SSKPCRQVKLSGPISPRSQWSLMASGVSGPVCLSSMATYQSSARGGPSLTGGKLASTGGSSSCGGGGSSGRSPSALSKAAPISASSTSLKIEFSPVGPSGTGGWGGDSSRPRSAASASLASWGRRTTMTAPHFLQRTLTPLAPTLSSEIMYCARQLSQTKRMEVWGVALLSSVEVAPRLGQGTLEGARPIYLRDGTSTLVPTASRSAARSSETAKVMSSRIFTFPAPRELEPAPPSTIFSTA